MRTLFVTTTLASVVMLAAACSGHPRKPVTAENLPPIQVFPADPPAWFVPGRDIGNVVPPPTFPQSAIDNCTGGKVVTFFVRNDQGKAESIQIVESEPPGLFDAAAIVAVKMWTFPHVSKNGTPYQKHAVLPFIFHPCDPMARSRS